MKRFSGREFAMLGAPICVIGGVAWWMASHPKTSDKTRDNGPVYLEFRMEKTTTLEAFRGANVAFTVGAKDTSGKSRWFSNTAPYLQIETPNGRRTSRQRNADSDPDWDQGLWNYSTNRDTDSRFLLKTDNLPAGKLRFGFDGKILIENPQRLVKFLHLKKEWDVDRSKISPFPFQELKPEPQVELRSFRITAVFKQNLEAEAVFVCDASMARQNTAFDY